MKIIDILPMVCIVLAACADHTRGLRSGDLVFLSAAASDFEKAISETTNTRKADFTHVGILDIVDGDTIVIEAIPGRGVTESPLGEVVCGCTSIVFVKVDDPAAAGAPAAARKYLGQPYDWQFLPDNGAVYCSELVQLSYVQTDGSPLFAPVPISFLDDHGRIPQFWLDIYARYGMQVPHAEPGSSPNSIFRQCDIYKKTEKK